MPSYFDKVIAAIRADGDHRGTSRQSITKHLTSEGKCNTSALKKALATGVAKGKITKDGARYRVVGDKVVDAPDDGFRMKDVDEGEGAGGVVWSFTTGADVSCPAAADAALVEEQPSAPAR